MEELKFDTMEVNYGLAEKYLKENKEHIEDILEGGKYERYWEPYPNYSRRNFGILADKIEENAELFAQLEVLSNPSLSVADVKNYDVKLMVQAARHWSSERSSGIWDYVKWVKLHDNDPLAVLGGALRYFPIQGINFCLAMPSSRVPVCLLFAQLCYEAGIGLIPLICASASDLGRPNKEVPSLDTIGVIAEQSDVDSAVDAFLKSPAKTCKLSRILVQESVYDNFNKAIAGKCELENQSSSGDDDAARLSVHKYLHVYGTKAFYVDFTGTVNQISDSKQVVLVEAFRTTKELLSLIKKYDPFCLSLWANDLSQANEVAYGTDVPVVWINDYGVLDGSPKVSEACYCRFDENPIKSIDKSVISTLKNNMSAWTKLSVQERIKIAKKALNTIKTEDDKVVNIISQLKIKLDSFKSKNSIEIEKGRLCVSIENPRGVTGFQFFKHFYSDFMILDFVVDQFQSLLKSLVYGNGLLHCWDDGYEENIIRKIVKAFEDAKMPLLEADKKIVQRFEDMTPYDVRFIYTSFGSTIFAN